MQPRVTLGEMIGFGQERCAGIRVVPPVSLVCPWPGSVTPKVGRYNAGTLQMGSLSCINLDFGGGLVICSCDLSTRKFRQRYADDSGILAHACAGMWHVGAVGFKLHTPPCRHGANVSSRCCQQLAPPQLRTRLQVAHKLEAVVTRTLALHAVPPTTLSAALSWGHTANVSAAGASVPVSGASSAHLGTQNGPQPTSLAQQWLRPVYRYKHDAVMFVCCPTGTGEFATVRSPLLKHVVALWHAQRLQGLARNGTSVRLPEAQFEPIRFSNRPAR